MRTSGPSGVDLHWRGGVCVKWRMGVTEEKIRMNCKCGRPTYMGRAEFEALIYTGRLQGLHCDTCDKPMVKVVFDPLSKI